MRIKYRISNVSILQTSKIIAVIYALLGICLVPFACLMFCVGTEDPISLVAGFFYLLAPLFYGIVGFIFTAIALWIYNYLASRIGGVEFEMEKVSEARLTEHVET